MQIRRLQIHNFRGIRELTWSPGPGINVIIGPGDTGKTTVLDAIALALSPQPSQAAAESDFRNADTTVPFRIQLALGNLSEEVQARTYPPPFWGWNAEQRQLSEGPNEELGNEPVLNIEVAATDDLELLYHILQPGNEPRPMSVPVRTAMGLWNVSSAKPPDTQLRMSRGSLLERALGREHLRAPALFAMQSSGEALRIPDEATASITRVAQQLREAGIEFDELALSLVPTAGQSPVQLVTLVAKSGGGIVPLSNFGRGSQQMAMVTLAASEIVTAPIAVIDEVEAGLEPYRQRALLAKLRALVADGGQAFLTSHSPAVLGRLNPGEVWRLRREDHHTLQAVEGDLSRLLSRDPEALLARLPIICEGVTEVGIARACFAALHDSDASALGIHLVDAGGHEFALRFIAALAAREQPTFALVDNETFDTGQRARLAEQAHVHLSISEGGRCIECAVANALPIIALPDFVSLPGIEGKHLDVTARLQAVSNLLGRQCRDPIPALVTEYGETAVREAVGEAAAKGGWFKTADAGEDLGRFILTNVDPAHPLRRSLQHLSEAALANVGLAADATLER
jgi:putative ATP-dependent endonuclease of OLD family